jgi:NAD+ kinase
MKNKNLKKIGIIIKPSKIEDLSNILTNLLRWLLRRSKVLYIISAEEERLSKLIPKKLIQQINFVDEKFVYNDVDILLSLGGDGTLLGVARKVSSKVPVFSVNLGRLGFITEFSKTDFYEKLNVIFLGKYDVIRKNLYSMTVTNKDKKIAKELFFNDIVFTKNDLARMFTLSVETEEEHIFNISGDGLIISSTYGSTAYSLAAGGPIVHPEVKALILTPICAHSLTHRPLVIPDNEKLKVTVLEKIDSVSVTMDGQTCVHLGARDLVTVKKESTKAITLIKNAEKTYFHTLKVKFVHGRREVY